MRRPKFGVVDTAHNPFSAVGTSVARSSGSLYCLSGQIPIGNSLLTLVYVASRS
jgi:hypothetical protein